MASLTYSPGPLKGMRPFMEKEIKRSKYERDLIWDKFSTTGFEDGLPDKDRR